MARLPLENTRGYQAGLAEAERRILAACGCGSADGCEGECQTPAHDHAIHNDYPRSECELSGCARYVRAVRGERFTTKKIKHLRTKIERLRTKPNILKGGDFVGEKHLSTIVWMTRAEVADLRSEGDKTRAEADRQAEERDDASRVAVNAMAHANDALREVERLREVLRNIQNVVNLALVEEER